MCRYMYVGGLASLCVLLSHMQGVYMHVCVYKKLFYLTL